MLVPGSPIYFRGPIRLRMAQFCVGKRAIEALETIALWEVYFLCVNMRQPNTSAKIGMGFIKID